LVSWKLEFEEGYFRIFDSKKLIAGYFDPDYGNLSEVKQNISRVSYHLQKWDAFLFEINNTSHFIGISHTDQDMLTVTFPVIFSKPTILEKTALLEEIYPVLNLLQKSELL
jgi:hypothetical protein